MEEGFESSSSSEVSESSSEVSVSESSCAEVSSEVEAADFESTDITMESTDMESGQDKTWEVDTTEVEPIDFENDEIVEETEKFETSFENQDLEVDAVENVEAADFEDMPDDTVSEVNDRTAMDNLTEYMCEHNYGRDDFETYSQDPEWRALHKEAFPDYEMPPLHEDLRNGDVQDVKFESNTELENVTSETKLEDLSKEDYEELKESDPETASQMLTEYNDRVIPEDDLAEMSKELDLDDDSDLEVVDEPPVMEKATVVDKETGEVYEVYPNPMSRVSHMEGQQGQNDWGMEQDCGIASTAKGVNDLYSKEVTTENRLVDYAKETGNCSLDEAKRLPDGTYDYSECGGTNVHNIKELYEANGLEAEAYEDENVLTPEEMGEALKEGKVVSLAVSSDVFWHYEDAKNFEPSNVDVNQYYTNEQYQRHVDTMMKLKYEQGDFSTDHAINVSNALYDKEGKLSHFIVSDTGTGKTERISVEHLQRSYKGDKGIAVYNNGCVVAGRRKES